MAFADTLDFNPFMIFHGTEIVVGIVILFGLATALTRYMW
jgi:hypothetical protein